MWLKQVKVQVFEGGRDICLGTCVSWILLALQHRCRCGQCRCVTGVEDERGRARRWGRKEGEGKGEKGSVEHRGAGWNWSGIFVFEGVCVHVPVLTR